MPRLGISEILEKVQEAKTADEKVLILRQNNSPVLRDILRLAYDKEKVWLLPEGTPPYEINTLTNQQGVLLGEWRKMYLFFEGGNPNLTPIKREYLFIQMLGSIDPKDAALICQIKDKKMPYKSITKNLIEKAYPGFFGVTN